ncbi:MAG: hypothetical protein LBC69_00750 [Eubacteriaceae bacterium]|jgi:uncharacterized protein YoxC|nr:hypothetical protein [Eubacteriaceae bacterium]
MQLQDVIQLLTLVVVSSLGTALTIYVILALRKITATMDRLDKLVSGNTEQISSIMANVSDITADANQVVSKVAGTVSGISRVVESVNKQSTVDSVVTAKKVFDVAKFAWSGIQFFRERSQRKQLEKVLKEAKAQN